MIANGVLIERTARLRSSISGRPNRRQSTPGATGPVRAEPAQSQARQCRPGFREASAARVARQRTRSAQSSRFA
jgi:hypothetical protein